MKDQELWNIGPIKYNNPQWAGDHFKKAYNMSIINGNCLIDIKTITLVGEK